MGRLNRLCVCVIGVLSLASCAEPLEQQQNAVDQAPVFARSGGGSGGGNRRHVVNFKSQVPANFTAQVTALGGRVLWVSTETGLAAVSGLSGSAAASLGGSSAVSTIDEDDVLALPMPFVGSPELAPDLSNRNPNPAGAARFARQWNMRVVQADVAWSKGFLGSRKVSVYMLDSGIDYLHTDLVGRVDLDRSIDLLGTFQTVTEAGDTVDFTEADTIATYFPERLPIADLFLHGTHTGATVSSNAVRAAGITSGAKLVAVKVCSYLDECPFSSILQGVIYGARNGADVMNLSLGGAIPKHGNRRLLNLINKTFEFAHRRGVTIVVSAGNEALDMDSDRDNYHAFCDTPAVICVSATGPTAEASVDGPWTNIDAPADYTNFGRRRIDLAAPGGNADSFVWAACSQTSAYIDCSASESFILGAQGTSMAAPHVAGAAALLVSQIGRHPDEIKERLEETADNVGGFALKQFYGNGRLNVARAVGAIRERRFAGR